MFIYLINCGISLDDFHGFPYHIWGERVGSKEGIQNRGSSRMGSRTIVHASRKSTGFESGCIFIVCVYDNLFFIAGAAVSA